MSTTRYWVVGGKFQSLEFDTLTDGTGRIWGPFETHSGAEDVWRDVSEQHRWSCCTRFTIVQENAGGPPLCREPRDVHALGFSVATNDHAEGFIGHE
jgi:hypothetical protein